jgi:hypothetical protein
MHKSRSPEIGTSVDWVEGEKGFKAAKKRRAHEERTVEVEGSLR